MRLSSRGLPAVGPVLDVMAMQAVGSGAAGEATSAVAARERTTHRGRDAAGAPPHTERLAVGAIHDRDDSERRSTAFGRSPPRWRCGARFHSVPPGHRRALPLRHGPRFRGGPARARGHCPRTVVRPIHASASARRTVRDGPRMNVPRGTSVRNTWASSLRWAAARSRAPASVAASAGDVSCRDVPAGTSSGAKPSLSHPAAGCSASCAAIAASSALRMRAPISGGNLPCSTTVPSSSCQKVRPRFSCWASARSVSSARFARR